MERFRYSQPVLLLTIHVVVETAIFSNRLAPRKLKLKLYAE